MYNACMANIQVRDVPEEIHGSLVERARSNGQSLQKYLAAELVRIASHPADAAAESAARLDAEHTARLERLQSVFQMNASEIMSMGIDLVERQHADRCRDRLDAVLESGFVGSLHDAPSDLAENHRQYLAETLETERDAG